MTTAARFAAVVLAVLVLGQLGCQSARQVYRDGDRGVVAIPANSNAWPTYNRDSADELMAQHFPEGYVIDREEEIAVGEATTTTDNHDAQTVSFLEGSVAVTNETGDGSVTTTTAPTTEYRIYYRRQ